MDVDPTCICHQSNIMPDIHRNIMPEVHGGHLFSFGT